MIKSNWIALFVIFLLLFNEIGHLAFKGIPFNDKVNLNAPVYYISLAFRNLMMSIFIYLLTPKKKIASRAIIAGAIGWSAIEFYQEICYILKIDEKVLIFNDGLWGQLSFILFIIVSVFLVNFGKKY